MPNNFRSLDAIQADLAVTNTGLVEARADVALLKRLSAAEQKVKALEAQERALTAERDKVLAALHKARTEERFRAVKIIKIVDETAGENVLRSRFAIQYSKMEWDMMQQRSIPVTREAPGFGNLSADVLDALLEFYPQMLPPKIVALYGDPAKVSLNSSEARQAMGRYFVGLRTGHISASRHV